MKTTFFAILLIISRIATYSQVCPAISSAWNITSSTAISIPNSEDLTTDDYGNIYVIGHFTSSLNFTNGNWIAANDTLTLGINTVSTGTLVRTTGHVAGYFRRWIASATASNVLFPIGTSAEFVSVQLAALFKVRLRTCIGIASPDTCAAVPSKV